MLSYTLLLANVSIFLLASATGLYFEPNYSIVQRELMFSPIYILTGSSPYTLFTYMFLHGSLFHLLMNLLSIIFLGTLFEEKAGTQPFAFIYFLSGIGSALIFALVEFGSNSGLVGASGAIFGILGALAILYPREKVRLLFFPYPISMASVVILFVLFEIFALFSISDDFIAHSGHLGGFLFGVALAKPALALSKLNSKLKLNALKAKRADIQNLNALATTPQLKEILQRIEKEDEEVIRLAWIEEFLKKAQCPKCGNKFKIEGKDHAKCTCGLEVYAK